MDPDVEEWNTRSADALGRGFKLYSVSVVVAEYKELVEFFFPMGPDEEDVIKVRLLRRRGFKLGLIKEGIRKAAAVDRLELLRERTEEDDKEERMIFATTYNPMISHLKDKVTNLHHMLHSSEKCKTLFPKPPVMAYRRGRNLNDLLVSRRLPHDTPIHPQPPTTSIDSANNKCEECGRLFKNGKGKMIHYKLCHFQKEPTPKTAGFHKCGDKRCNTCKL